MKRLFGASLFGFRRRQVKAYILSLRKDYEEELSKKQDRMLDLNAENRKLRSKILKYEDELSQYREQELFISKAIVKAEESAQSIMKECHHRIGLEKHKINQEKEKWRIREKKIMKELLSFQNEAYSLMESFQSEINYLTAKEIVGLGNERAEDDINTKDEEILSISSI